MDPSPAPVTVASPFAAGSVVSPLVVRTDPAPLRRRLGIVLGVTGTACVLVLLGAVWLASFAGFWASLPVILIVANLGFQMVWYAFSFGRRMGTDPVAHIGSEGIAINALRHGWVSLPWPAVASITGGGQQLIIKPVSQATERAPSVTGPADDGFWRKAERRGLRIGAVGITPDLGTVRAAVAHFSGGRHPDG